jgi:hypothetical protein
MDLQKVIGKNLKAAERLVFQIETDVSRNQNNLIDAKQRVEELIKEGTLLSEKLAAAKEYLQDLEQSKTD